MIGFVEGLCAGLIGMVFAAVEFSLIIDHGGVAMRSSSQKPGEGKRARSLSELFLGIPNLTLCRKGNEGAAFQ
jgi:hypothetical protein